MAIIPTELFDCVVFGATGDLTLRKLLPALYYRFKDKQIPEGARIIGAARSDLTSDAYREKASAALNQHVAKDDRDAEVIARFLETVHYVHGNAAEAG
ncbi:MAG: glucose-6-phosphate dehydrogenase, partial [Janthinobacterium lividum]